MLEKILDKYYSKKLVDYILNTTLLVYNIDKKVVFKKNYFEIYIKKRMFNDNFYKTIVVIPYSESCETLMMNRKELNDSIRECVNLILNKEEE